MLTGTASLDELVEGAATLDSFDVAEVVLPDVDVLQVLFETRHSGREASLPPALHPTNPPTFVVQVWRCPDSPWGPFSVAQGRVGSRSGLRPRGMIQGCIVDDANVVAALRCGWGIPARLGEVALRRRYDGVEAQASVDGSLAVSVVGVGAEPLGPDDVAYSTGIALAHTPRGLRLVQIDVDVAVSDAVRMRPRLEHHDASVWGVHPAVVPYHPVSATVARATVTLERLRYVCKPDELAFTGTEPV
jgi:hypothetical protein